MLTALGDKHLISQYLLDGANDYIVKPFDLEEVYARVSVQLRERIKGSSTTDNIYQVKNIKINPDSFEVSGNGFNSEKAWNGNDIGFDKIKINPASEKGSDIISVKGNIGSSKAGWYLMIVECTVEGRDVKYNVSFNNPNV